MTPKTWQSMPDSVALSPVSGKSHFKRIIRAHPAGPHTRPPMPNSWYPRNGSQSYQQIMLGLQRRWQVRHRKQGEGVSNRGRRQGAHITNKREQKQFPPQIKTVNMINAIHIPKRERTCILRDVDSTKQVAPQYKLWPITYDHTDRPANSNQGNSDALILDPIICGFHLTRVLMDGGSSLNLLYQDTVRLMGIDHSMIKPTKTSFKGVIPGAAASCIGSTTLEVVFG